MSQKLTTEEFIKKAREVHGDKYDYSKVEYVNNQTKVCIICKEHGEFWQRPLDHLKGHECSECGKIKNVESRRKTLDQFIDEARKLHGDKYDYSNVKYKNTSTKVCIICKKHGEFWQAPYTHLNGHGCPKCAYKGDRQRHIYSQEEIIDKIRSFFGERYSFEKVIYKAMKVPIILVCHEKDEHGIEHGEFSMRPDNIFSGVHFCFSCCFLSSRSLLRNLTSFFLSGFCFVIALGFCPIRGISSGAQSCSTSHFALT